MAAPSSPSRSKKDVQRILRDGPNPGDRPLVGLMMRHDWCEELLHNEEASVVDWLEVYPENYIWRGGRYQRDLELLADRWAMTAHGVHLNLAGVDPLDDRYTTPVREWLDRFEMPHMSEHLGATINKQEVLHEILPVPMREETCARVADRVRESRDRLGRPLLVENTCFYFKPPGSNWSEQQMITELLERSDGHMLLDVNNLYVNAQNHGTSAIELLDNLPWNRVKEIHVGGFTVDGEGGMFIDSHAAAPSQPVWRLLVEAFKRGGAKPVMVEWETHWPSLNAVFKQLQLVHRAWDAAQEKGAA